MWKLNKVQVIYPTHWHRNWGEGTEGPGPLNISPSRLYLYFFPISKLVTDINLFPFINSNTCSANRCIFTYALGTWRLQIVSMRQTSFVKTTSSVGCVGGESNAPVDSNAGEPTRPWTSGIDCFGAEDATSVESSTGEPSRPSCAATFVSQEQQCKGGCCRSMTDFTACHPTLAELP